jgi:hypothetical protein
MSERERYHFRRNFSPADLPEQPYLRRDFPLILFNYPFEDTDGENLLQQLIPVERRLEQKLYKIPKVPE